jgi:hypothetical protein
MEIVHRVTFGKEAGVDAELDTLGISYIKSPLFHRYILTFEIYESDPRWPRVNTLMRENDVSSLVETVFSDEEILDADWLRMTPTFEHGYPQPKSWLRDRPNYENWCYDCGSRQQKSSFFLKKEPNLRKNDFMMLFWTDAFFCTPGVFQEFEAHGLRGYEKWEALIYKTRQPSETVSQLFIPHVATPGLVNVEDLKRVTCQACGVTKYYPHVRGIMYLQRNALVPDVDFMRTYEWFGDGHAAYRQVLVSNRVAKLIINKGWRGVRFKVVELVD